MKVTDIKTEVGNKILEDLASQGWKTIREYSPVAFDKGVDFDIKWNNWFEWEIVGMKDELEIIVEQYSLSSK